jgi:photosystem II stability/assembly factor-like uncharacterized protein
MRPFSAGIIRSLPGGNFAQVRFLPGAFVVRGAIVLASATALAFTAGSDTRSQRWISHGPPGGAVEEIEIDPRNPAIVYAAGSAGVFKSTDGGRSWSRRSDGLPLNVGTTHLEVDPSDPSTVYFQPGYTNWLSKTTDGAGSWKRLDLPGEPEDPISITDVEVDPSRSGRVYLALFDGLYRTDDGGASWQLLPGPHAVRNLAVAPSAPSVVYAQSSGGLSRSNDAGITWAQVSPRTHALDNALAVDLRNPNTIYFGNQDGFWKSVDGGATVRLTLRTTGLNDVSVLAIDPRRPDHVYAGGDDGRFWGLSRSTDGGNTWKRLRARFWPYDSIRDLEVGPAQRPPLLAGFLAGGVFRSANAGTNWRAANRGLSSAGVIALSGDPSRRSTVYAGMDFWGGVARSADAGRHWSKRRLLGRSVIAFASSGGTVFAAARDGIYRSRDHGLAWRRVLAKRDSPWTVAVAPSDPRFVYTSFTQKGVFRSHDGGRSWHLAGRFRLVKSFAIHPRDPRRVWASAAGGIQKSNDGGRTWRTSTSFPYVASQFAFDPRRPRTVYAAVEGGPRMLGIFKTVDGGAHWVRRATGITTEGMVAVVIDPHHPRTLYAGGCGYDRPGGVYKSTNAARTWTNISAGLTSQCVTSLALVQSGRTLQIGTGGGGVFTKRVR